MPLFITFILFATLFGIGSLNYTGFFSLQVFLNLFIDNAFLIITAVGITFVLLTGGIDISVGAVIAFTCMLSAYLLEKQMWSAYVVIPIVLGVGSLLGFCMGYAIHHFKVQPFIATLAGMFFARGMCYVISVDSIIITNPFYKLMSQTRIPFVGGTFLSPSVIIAFMVVILAIYIAHFTKFGRTVYAIGGNEQSALLMGLPVARTKVLVYMLNGFCSALAGIIFSFYMLSGYGLHTLGLELDAIASAVIGGTLLTGGVGYVVGTVFGVIIQGVIQTLIMFQGTLSSWWTKIAIAFLLCLFIVLQRLFTMMREKKKANIS